MNFDIKIYPLRNNIELINLNVPYDYETIIKELENEDWSHTAENSSKRHVLLTPKSEILIEIKDFLISHEVKEKLINKLFLDFPVVKETWNGWTEQQMCDRTYWKGYYIKDDPDYHLTRHVDTRTNVAQAIIYLNKDADERRTTLFYTDKQGNNELKIDNKFLNGVLYVNDVDTWHEASNKTNEPRYVIICFLILALEFCDF